jgi:hypothetical protein
MYTGPIRECDKQEWQVTSKTRLRGHISAAEGCNPIHIMVAIRYMTFGLCGSRYYGADVTARR